MYKRQPYALTEADLPVLFEQYEILAREMLRREEEGRGFTFYHYMIDLKGGPCIYKRISGCGSGTEYLAVTPWGELFPCHQFVGDPAYSMGNVWDGVTTVSYTHLDVYKRQGLLGGRKVVRVLHRLLEGVGIEIDDLLRSALGSDDAAGAAVPLIVVAEFTEGGGVGIFFKALGINDAEDLDLALAGGEVRDLCNREVNLSLAQRKKLVGGAAVRDGRIFKLSGLGEKLCADVVGSLRPDVYKRQMSSWCATRSGSTSLPQRCSRAL